MMRIEGSTALVTGANRGLGRRLAEELLARGAKVYAGARDPGSVDLAGVTPVAWTSPTRLRWRPRPTPPATSAC
jgi:NAD(P)-dependent dehydrogenase (short-subunit alcohol dehydrogenase family)